MISRITLDSKPSTTSNKLEFPLAPEAPFVIKRFYFNGGNISAKRSVGIVGVYVTASNYEHTPLRISYNNSLSVMQVVYHCFALCFAVCPQSPTFDHHSSSFDFDIDFI